ncbi:lipopolysaccharide biosynthesis protein [Dyella silvae]|uniref:lipopolysaccharide biosynthesis protein n=1 Tax=Dyella silvae TaxID=2994424 RepID=UPI0022650ABA|nr:lipopolysaccharide biosynthesis protein [Dyella silvae]
MIVQLMKGSLWTAAVLALRLATQAGSLVLLTRLFGPQTYGHFASAAALAVVMGTLPNLGSGYLLLKKGSRDINATADLWRYAWPLTAVLGTTLLAAYVICGHWLAQGLLAWPILLYIGTTELLATPFTMLFSFALQAGERVPTSQFVQWLPLGLRVMVAVPCFLLPSSERLSAYVMLQFLASVLGALFGWVITRRHIRLDWQPRTATANELKEGSSYAAMLIVSANPTELDKIMAVRQVGAMDAGIYIAGSRVMGALVMPVLAMLLTAQPRLFRHAHEQTNASRRLVRTIFLLALTWGALSGAVLAAASPLLPQLFGDGYLPTAQLMPWMAVTAPFLSLRLAAGSVLISLGHPLERVSFELCGVALLLIGMLAFTHFMGVLGLVVAVILAEAAMCVLGLTLVNRHIRRGA